MRLDGTGSMVFVIFRDGSDHGLVNSSSLSSNNLIVMPNTSASLFESLRTFGELKNKESNSRVYCAMKDSVHSVDIGADVCCPLAPGYRLIRLFNQEISGCGDFLIALLNDVECSVVYCNIAFRLGGKSPAAYQAVQCHVWQTPSAHHYLISRKIKDKVLFGYIVKEYDVVLDSSEIGVNLWLRELSKALAYGLNVYCKQPSGTLQCIPTQKALNDFSDDLWSAIGEQAVSVAFISASCSGGPPIVSLLSQSER